MDVEESGSRGVEASERLLSSLRRVRELPFVTMAASKRSLAHPNEGFRVGGTISIHPSTNKRLRIGDRLDEVKNAPAGSALYDRKFHSYRAEVAEFGCGRPHPGRGRDLLAARARARNARGTRGKEG